MNKTVKWVLVHLATSVLLVVGYVYLKKLKQKVDDKAV
jgi:hypothetical protein